MSKPIYTHDCTACRYLGTVVNTDAPTSGDMVDLYVCPAGGLGPSIIGRFGSEGWNYASSPASYLTGLPKVHAFLHAGKILAGL